MLQVIKKWFSKKEAINKTADNNTVGEVGKRVSKIYDIKYLTIDELDKYPDAIRDIYEGRLDGMLIKDAFQKEERDPAIACAYDDKLSGFAPNFGKIIGIPLNLGMMKDVYLEQSEKFNANVLPQIFPFGFEQKIINFFNKVSGSRPVQVPAPNGRSYICGNLRVMEPQKGALRAHTGNEFFIINKSKGLEWLGKNAHVVNCMSYFTLLQKPEKGGEIILYDLLWDDTHLNGQFGQFGGNQREIEALNAYDYEAIKMDAGDLLIFNGGKIWHQVTPIEGKVDRITFGGFMAFAKDMERIYFWT